MKQPTAQTKMKPGVYLLLGILIGVITSGLFGRFNANYTLKVQSPVIIRLPVLIQSRHLVTPQVASPSAKPTATPSATPEPLETTRPRVMTPPGKKVLALGL